MTALTASSTNSKPNKFILAQNVWRSGKTCMEKIKALLKVMDSTAAMLVRSSKRWSMAAAITVGIDDENEDNMDDEDTISGRQSTLMNTHAFYIDFLSKLLHFSFLKFCFRLFNSDILRTQCNFERSNFIFLIRSKKNSQL